MSNFILPWSGRSINYTEDDIEAVVKVMLTADPLTQGIYQEWFETAFGHYHNLRHCFAVNSCASALELAATLINLRPKDEVIIPAHTYCATAIPFARRGAKIIWADIHPEYYIATAEQIAPLVTEKTKAVVVVHLYGVNTPMDDIMKMSFEKGFYVIEDCAQSLGASYKGYKSGWHGNMACYSFHGQKNISTLGEGGMLTVKSAEKALKVPGLRHNGHRGYPAKKLVDFDMRDVYPYNYSIGEAQCALGISLMRRLDELNSRRRKHARLVIDRLQDFPELKFQQIPEGSTHSYHLLVARYPKRDQLMKGMHENKVETVIQYLPLYRQPLFRDFRTHQCLNTEEFYSQALSFPLYEWYENYQLEYLIESIRKALVNL